MSEIKESLKKIVMAGFGAAAETSPEPSDSPADQKEEEILALLSLLPLDTLRDIRTQLDGLIAAKEEKAPEEAIESIKEACLAAPPTLR